jgi:hypothetical protein
MVVVLTSEEEKKEGRNRLVEFVVSRRAVRSSDVVADCSGVVR